MKDIRELSYGRMRLWPLPDEELQSLEAPEDHRRDDEGIEDASRGQENCSRTGKQPPVLPRHEIRMLNMRSQDVFAAAKQISNRFLLCRVTSVSSHRLHIAPKHFSESINRALHEIAQATEHTEENAMNRGGVGLSL